MSLLTPSAVNSEPSPAPCVIACQITCVHMWPRRTSLPGKLSSPLPNQVHSLIQIHFVRLHAGLVPRLIGIPSVDGKLLDAWRGRSSCLCSPTDLHVNSSRRALRSLWAAFRQQQNASRLCASGRALQDPSLALHSGTRAENPSKDLPERRTLAHLCPGALSSYKNQGAQSRN